MIVLVDNGHGIDTKGKCSPDRRLFEFKWAREIARMVVAELQAFGIDARLLVPEETDVPITTRVRRVNSICDKVGSQNVLLVSIHNNACGNDGQWHDASGFSVFCSKNASSKSKFCASIFTDEAESRHLLGNRSIPAGRFWTWSWTKADIGILKNSKCPAVLTENLFQDNKTDVNLLLSGKGKKDICDLHVKAIVNYINSQKK